MSSFLHKGDAVEITFAHLDPQAEFSGGQIGESFAFPLRHEGDPVTVELFHIFESVTGNGITLFIAHLHPESAAGTGGKIYFHVSALAFQHPGQQSSGGKSCGKRNKPIRPQTVHQLFAVVVEQKRFRSFLDHAPGDVVHPVQPAFRVKSGLDPRFRRGTDDAFARPGKEQCDIGGRTPVAEVAGRRADVVVRSAGVGDKAADVEV